MNRRGFLKLGAAALLAPARAWLPAPAPAFEIPHGSAARLTYTAADMGGLLCARLTLTLELPWAECCRLVVVESPRLLGATNRCEVLGFAPGRLELVGCSADALGYPAGGRPSRGRVRWDFLSRPLALPRMPCCSSPSAGVNDGAWPLTV